MIGKTYVSVGNPVPIGCGTWDVEYWSISLLNQNGRMLAKNKRASQYLANSTAKHAISPDNIMPRCASHQLKSRVDLCSI